MNRTWVTYIGTLPSGSVRSGDGRETFHFKRGEAVECTERLALELHLCWPDDWTVTAEVMEMAEEVKRAREAAAAHETKSQAGKEK